MTETIGLAVASETQPVWTQKDIKRILNELTAERRHGYELADQLKEAKAENAELRSKVADLQPEPDWSHAPPDAQWWAMDDNGQSYWFVEYPTKHERFGYWGSSAGAILAGETLAPAWESSLRQRPGT